MLIDFGIARFLPPGGRGTQIGSVGYAPPEQYMGKVEPRSDLYSLAATMHHLLTGRDPQLEPPFSFPPLRDLNPAVSIQTAEVVMRALDKDVEKRPRAARDMMHALPDPGPEPKAVAAGAFIAGAAAGAAPIASMPTVVLDHAQAAPAIVPAGRGVTPAAGPGEVAASPSSARARAAAPPLTTMPTVVLSKPAPLPPPAPAVSSRMPTAVPASPPPLRAGEPAHLASTPRVPAAAKAAKALARSAKAVARRAASRIQAQQMLFANPAASVSSTAKTQDLAGKGAPLPPPSAAAPIPRTVAGDAVGVALKNAAAPASRNGSAAVSVDHGAGVDAARSAGAWLVASGNSPRFGLAGSRIVIGRALPGREAPDIDLGTLKSGGDRVSQRHAEIIKHGADYYIRDLGSLNGTYITGRGRVGRDQLYKLKDRDQIVCGSAKLEFRKS